MTPPLPDPLAAAANARTALARPGVPPNAPGRPLSSAVSREAYRALPGPEKRRYRCPKKAYGKAATNDAFLDAVVTMASRGDFRPSRAAVSAIAGRNGRTLTKNFRAMDLLYRSAARERWRELAAFLPGLDPAAEDFEAKAKKLAWLVLVGKPRD